MLRAAGDVGNGALSWLSPIGWGQRTFPYAGRPVVAAAARRSWPPRCWSRVAVALLDRRDFGAGLVPSRPGRADRLARRCGSPLGLAWRLQRGSLIGWAVGLLLLGAAYGSIGDSIEQYVADNPEIAEFLPGGAADVVNSYLALTILMSRPDRGGVRRDQRAAGARPRRPPGGPSRCWPPRPAG